jgi:hypothetical protein
MRIYRSITLMLVGILSLQAFSLEAPLPEPTQAVVLTVTGAITNKNEATKALFDWPMLRALPKHSLQTDTSVTSGEQQFTGFLLKDLLQKVGATGKQVTAIALNDYQVTIPIEDFEHFKVIAAYEMNTIPLTPSDKGPLWIVYPRSQHSELRDIRYDYRWVWQLIELRVEP